MARAVPTSEAVRRGQMRFGLRAATDGFSVFEVMMAAGVLLVGFVGVIQVISQGSEALDTARKRQVAEQIVAAEIEKLRGGAWTTIANLPSSGSIQIGQSGAITGDMLYFALSNHTSSSSDDNTELCAQAHGFSCSFTRENLRPTAASSATVTFLKLIYTVSWTSNTGRAHTHKVETYLGKNGLHLSYQQS